MEEPKNLDEVQPQTPEEIKLVEARSAYAVAYKAFLAERKEEANYAKRAWRFLNGSNISDEEIPEELKRLEREYDNATVAFGGTMFDEKRKELVALNLSPEEEAEELNKFKQKDVFNRVIVQEHEELNKLKVENLPPKEKGVVRKSLEWYMGLKPAWKKVAISSLLSTGAIVLFSSGAVVMTAGTVAGIAGGRIARAAVGTVVGQGVSKAYDYFFKDHSAEEREAAEKELSEVFESNDALRMSFKETQRNYSEILEEEQKAKRKRLIQKAVVGLAAGAGTSYGMGQALDLHEQISDSNELVKSSNADMATNDEFMLKLQADEAARIQAIDLKKLQETDQRLEEIKNKIDTKTYETETPAHPEPAPMPIHKIETNAAAETLRNKLMMQMSGETPEPVSTHMPSHTPIGLGKYSGEISPKIPEIAPAQIPNMETLVVLQQHPEFVLNNSYVLSSQQLAETYNVHYQNINHLLPNNTAENWYDIGKLKAKDLLNADPVEQGKNMGPIVSYMQQLRTESGLKPESGLFGIGGEKTEHYVARALQKIEADGHLHKVTLHTPVPKSPDLQHITQAVQPEIKHEDITNIPVQKNGDIIIQKSVHYPLYDSAKVHFSYDENGNPTEVLFNKSTNQLSGRELSSDNFMQEMRKWAQEHNKDQQWEIDKAIVDLNSLYKKLAVYDNLRGDTTYIKEAEFVKNTITRDLRWLSEYGHIIDFSKLPPEFQPPLK
ncbi:MAG: hypothetical protein Q7K54_04275 [Candidatus Parcubacteria bacterium]|nr:hypothetical protein [Candidatus Parcubacteria bacterium]